MNLSSTAPTTQEESDMPATAPSFENDIKPLFRESDPAMLRLFDLWLSDDVTPNASSDAVRAGSMPCDLRWSSEKADLLRRWIDSGTPE
jgi:hypothetical protein